MNKLFLLLFVSVMIFCSAYKKPDFFTIDAVTNASRHNTLGTQYLSERFYAAAIQEFKIAISLNPDTQSSAVYYNNLGNTYMKLGFVNQAQDCLERAIKLYGLNFQYYQNLAQCYKKQKKTNMMISRTRTSKNPLDKVLLGLLYIENGDKQRGIMTLDDFSMSEPDLIITQGVRRYLQDLTKK